MGKQEIIEKIKAADISREDWFEDILPEITDLYAKGYISAKVDDLTDSYMTTDEDFRDELLKICGWEIWGQK